MAASEEASGGGDLIDFVLYMFVLGPAVEWCLKSPRVNRGRPASPPGIALAVLLLAAIAGVKLSWELVGRDLNHFETLGVRVDSSPQEIKKAYRQISLEYHPDKNPDMKDAAQKFIKYQAAYEVLKDASKRDLYNNFGQAGLDDKTSDTSSQLWSLSLFYIIWLVVGYLLTMGKASEDGRTWAFSGLLTLAVFEYQTKILSVDYLAPIFPHSTVYEKVEILHKLFPPFLHGARMISQVLFTDISLVNKLRLEEMHLKTDDLFQQITVLNNGSSAGTQLTASGESAVASAQPGVSEESRRRAASASKLAEETASHLHSKNQLPEVSLPQAAGAAPVQPAATAAGGNGAAAAATPEAAAAVAAAAAAAAAEQERNKNRMTNVGIFFVAYVAFKYAVDNELF